MNITTQKKALTYRWIIFWILALGYVLVYFHRQCPAVLAMDLMRDLKTGGKVMGLFGSLYFYPYALMQLPAGLLSDSWGPRRTITLFFIIAVTGSAILGAAPNIHWALGGRLLVGIGVAMLFVPTLKVLSQWFRVREFATMMGILMAMGGLGSMTSAAPLAFLSNAVGWRNSFFLVGGLTVLLALLVWFFVRDTPAEKGWAPIVDSDNSSEDSISLRKGLALVLKEKGFWFLGGWFFFTMSIFFSFGGLWGGPFLMNVYGLDKNQAGGILSMLAVGMIVGSPLLSFVSDKIFKSRKKVIVICSVINCVIAAFLAFNTNGFSIAALYILCFSLGAFTSSVVVIGFTANKELFPVAIAGSSTGLINLFPFAGGAVFQQVLGFVLERHGKVNNAFTLEGYESAFLVLFVCSVIALLFSLRVKETFT
ncbi:MAG: MFS transporter [bacterium]|nr:MFS transporter [bacterium]